MGKVMIKAQPGALADVLKERSKTQEEVAGAIGCSRKTIQIINSGSPVKDTTLKKIANYLRVPVDHLVPESVNPALIDKNQAVKQIEIHDEVLLHPIDGNGIYALLIFLTRIVWRLDVRPDVLSIPALRALEPAVENFFSDIYSKDFSSLNDQLKTVELIESVDQLLNSIAEHKLHVLGDSFVEWSCTDVDGYYDFNLDCHVRGKRVYKSESVAILCVESTSVKSKRVKIWTGSKPPKFSRPEGPEVWVNGKLLPIAEV